MAGSALRRNSLSVPSQPLRPSGKSESFWELKFSAESGSLTTPALGLQDVMKSFLLYVNEQKRTAIGVLTQLLGSWHHPAAYLSKQPNAIS
jgi:hypothetical protein